MLEKTNSGALVKIISQEDTRITTSCTAHRNHKNNNCRKDKHHGPKTSTSSFIIIVQLTNDKTSINDSGVNQN